MAFTQVVSAGMTVSDEIIASGSQTVLTGGTTSDCVMSGEATLIISGGTVDGLVVSGYPNRKNVILMYGGTLVSATINNRDPNWYADNTWHSHMVVFGGVISATTINFGYLNTSGTDITFRDVYFGGEKFLLNDYRGLGYANVRIGAGYMYDCTAGGACYLFVGYSPFVRGTVECHNLNVVYSGYAQIDSNAKLYDTTVTGGTLYINGAAQIENVALSNIGYMFISGTAVVSGCTVADNASARIEGAIKGLTTTGGKLLIGSAATLEDATISRDTLMLGVINNGYLLTSQLSKFNNVTIAGLAANSTSIYLTPGGKLNNIDATSLTKVVVDGATLVMYAAGKMSGITIENAGWLQCSNGTVSDVTIKGYGARYELMSANVASSVVVDGLGSYATGFGTGARLVVFRGGHANLVTLQNGGSAHIYGSGSVLSNVTVKSGGILYTRDIYGSESNNGTAEKVTVEDGGVIVLGHSKTTSGTALISSLKIAESGIIQITGCDFVVTGGQIEENGVYKPFAASNGVITGLILHSGGYFNGYGIGDVSGLVNVTVHDGAYITNVSADSTISGVYVFADGSSKALSIAGGVVSGFVVAKNASLFGGASATTLASLTILDGGTLSGISTDDTVDGTYVFDDGTSAGFSIAGKVASGLFFNNGGTFTVAGGGSAMNVSLNSAVMYMAVGAVASGIAMRNDTSLMISTGTTLSGINYNYLEGAGQYEFTVADGVASHLVISDGGFLSLGSGDYAIQIDVVGSRGDAAAGYTDEFMQMFGGASFLAAGSGSMIDGAGFKDGAIFYIGDSSAKVTASNLQFSATGTVNLTLGSSQRLSGITYGFAGDAKDEFRTFNFDGSTLSNVRVIGSYGKLVLGSNMTVDGIEVIGTFANIVSDATNTFKDLYVSVSGTFALDAAVYGARMVAGELQARGIVSGAIVSSGATLATSLSAARFSDIGVAGGIVRLGTAKNQWAGAQAGSVIDGITVTSGSLVFNAGTLKNLTMTGGTFTYDAAGSNGTYGRDGIVLNMEGGFYFRNSTIANGYTNAIDMTSATGLELAGSNTIKTNVSMSLIDGVVNITGDGNAIDSGCQVTARTIVFDVTGLTRAGAGMVNYLPRINAITTTGLGELRVDLDVRQYYVVLGQVTDGSTTFARSLRFMFTGDTRSTQVSLNSSYTKDGYTYTVTTQSVESPGYAILLVQSTVSTNTKLSWFSYSNGAPTFVNDIAETSGTVYLGNTLETTSGGHAIESVGGNVIGAGIVTDLQERITVYGGSNLTSRAQSFIKVTGGQKNYIYGGGNGKDVASGTNIYITNGNSLCSVYGGGINSNIGAGSDGNAVNINIVGGTQRDLYGGGKGGTITGNINLQASNSTVSSIVTGGGESNVNGSISVKLGNLVGDVTANIYGGSVVNAANLTVSGSVALSITGGRYLGILYGGGRGYSSYSNVTGGDVSVTVSNMTQLDNPKLLKDGNSAWIIGGGVADGGGKTTVAGSVYVNVTGGASVVRVVGGSQAQGSGSIATINGDTVVTIGNCSVTDAVYGGGYAYDSGVSVVEGTSRIVVNASGSTVTIGGNIYAGGANPMYSTKGGSSSVLGGSEVSFSGSGDLLSFSGVVDGDGKIAGTVQGTKAVSFDDFTGGFFGLLKNIDVVTLAGDTRMTSANSYTVSTLCFDLSKRSFDLSDYLFVEDTSSFSFESEGVLKFVLDADTLGSDNFKFALLDVSDEDIEGLTVQLYGSDGYELASADIADAMDGGIALNGKGVFSLSVDEFGGLNANFKKGALA
ncbi:MAG: beta strand repeat-containing protein [Victivallaceae bacterium]|nr:hypothetical protein [Victivallaceae bacterium]